MESLIVCALPRLPMPPALAETPFHCALARATLLDNMRLAHAWRKERIAVDPNRRVVVLNASRDAAWSVYVDAQAKQLELTVEAVDVTDSTDGADGMIGAAFARAFDRGARAVAAIASTAPALTLPQIDLAFRALQWEAAVLGPILDGSAWLVGAVRHPAFAAAAPLDLGVDASAQMVDAAQKLGARLQLLPYWYSLSEVTRVAHLRWQLQLLPDDVAPATRATLVDIA